MLCYIDDLQLHYKCHLTSRGVQVHKFATGQILKKPVGVVKGWILAGWAQKSPEPWFDAKEKEKRKESYKRNKTLGTVIKAGMLVAVSW
jgi:hypothetical protein